MDTTAETPVLVLYDGDCGFCIWTVGGFLRLARRGSLRTRPIQDSLHLLPGLDPDTALRSFHVVTADGDVASAGAGLARLCRHVPLLRPVGAVLGRIPGLSEWLYRQVAGRRGTFARGIPERSGRRARRAVRAAELAA